MAPNWAVDGPLSSAHTHHFLPMAKLRSSPTPERAMANSVSLGGVIDRPCMTQLVASCANARWSLQLCKASTLRPKQRVHCTMRRLILRLVLPAHLTCNHHPQRCISNSQCTQHQLFDRKQRIHCTMSRLILYSILPAH